MKPREQKARRREQCALLTEMEQVTGLHRKSLLRLLHARTLERKQRAKGRGRTYGKAWMTLAPNDSPRRGLAPPSIWLVLARCI